MHLSEVASEYRRKADANLPPTTKRLLLENYQLNGRVTDMYDEIKLLQQQSVEWRAEDERQINHMRDLEATNADITNRNITIRMVREQCSSFSGFEGTELGWQLTTCPSRAVTCSGTCKISRPPMPISPTKTSLSEWCKNSAVLSLGLKGLSWVGY